MITGTSNRNFTINHSARFSQPILDRVSNVNRRVSSSTGRSAQVSADRGLRVKRVHIGQRPFNLNSTNGLIRYHFG